jgi:hypothetical protein
MPTFDQLEPRTNKSVFAFAAAIRDQLSAILRGDFLSGQGFTKFQLWQTLTDTAGGGGLALGDNSGAMWNLRSDTAGSLHFDRFSSGAWFGSALTLDKATGRVLMGSGQTAIPSSDSLAVGTLDGQTASALSVRKGGKSVRLYSSDTLQIINAYDDAAAAALELRVQSSGGTTSFGGQVLVGASAVSSALLFVNGGTYNTGIHVRSNALGAGLSLENTSAAGHRFSIFSTGTGSPSAVGGLAISDETQAAYRALLDGNGRWIFGAASGGIAGSYLVDFASSNGDIGRFRATTAAGTAAWEVAAGDGTTSSKVAQLNFRALMTGGTNGWDTGMVTGGMLQAGDYSIVRKNGALTQPVFGIDSNNYNVGFLFGSAASSFTFGGGQGVIFVGNRGVAPGAAPSGGFVMYAEGGAAKVRGGSGTTTTFGPADPHCPACGADFATEHYNPEYGYVSICLFCLAAELGERPYIIHHQTGTHAARVEGRLAAHIAAAKTQRLAEARALIAQREGERNDSGK